MVREGSFGIRQNDGFWEKFVCFSILLKEGCMFRLGLRSLLFLALSIILTSCGKINNNSKTTPPAGFKAGKDYEVISTSEIIPKSSPKAQVRVVEFFSYACPACYHFESTLDKWLAKKPAYVKFERVLHRIPTKLAQFSSSLLYCPNVGGRKRIDACYI